MRCDLLVIGSLQGSYGDQRQRAGAEKHVAQAQGAGHLICLLLLPVQVALGSQFSI